MHPFRNVKGLARIIALCLAVCIPIGGLAEKPAAEETPTAPPAVIQSRPEPTQTADEEPALAETPIPVATEAAQEDVPDAVQEIDLVPGPATVYTDEPGDRDGRTRVSMRRRPTTDGSLLFRYYTGNTVEVLDLGENGYVHVQIGPIDGYMLAQYLRQDDVERIADKRPIGKVNVPKPMTSLGLQELPNASATIIKSLSNDDEVLVLGVGREYLHVRTVNGDTEGFLPVKYVVEANELLAIGNVYGTLEMPVNLREGPSTSTASLGKYYGGALMYFLFDSNKSEKWNLVRIGDTMGYISEIYTTYGEANPLYYKGLPVREVKADAPVELRDAPKAKGEVILSLKPGTKAEIQAVVDDWYHVIVDGQYGYIQAKYLP